MNEYDFVLTFKSIISGVLASLQIRPTAAHYDDCYQVGLIKLFDAFKDYPGDFESEEGLYQFGGYAFQKVKWAVIDECRKVMRSNERETELPDRYEELTLFTEDGIEAAVLNRVDLAEFLLWLTNREQDYLNEYLKHGSITKVAEAMGVSRKTVYVIRKKIAEKYEMFNS